MKGNNKILRQLELRAQLSGQPLPGIPIVELAGNRRVLIENHCGVKEYLDNRVCVGVGFGSVHIEGAGLEISRMSSNQLVITGSIDAIRLERSCR